MTPGERTSDRRLIALSGLDAVAFLQGLVTNDLRPLMAAPGIVWAALLTPQGKYLADFFVVRQADAPDLLLIDVAVSLADDLVRRLTLYVTWVRAGGGWRHTASNA